MIKFSIWMFFLGCLTPVFPQETWYLEHCVELAQQNSLTLIVASLKSKQVQSEAQSVASFYLPQLHVSSNQNYIFGSAIDPASK